MEFWKWYLKGLVNRIICVVTFRWAHLWIAPVPTRHYVPPFLIILAVALFAGIIAISTALSPWYWFGLAIPATIFAYVLWKEYGG